jgi:hypothetical protein
MKKPIVALLIFLLFVDVSVTVFVGARLSNPPVAPQPELTAKSSSLPSPLSVAAWIVGLVAVFGALLSLALHGRHTSQADAKSIRERFWAIDSYSVCWSVGAS